MRVYATELICSTEVLGFHTFKLALCIYNKLRSHAEVLSWWAFDVTFPGSNPLRSNRSGPNVSNGRSRNPKFTLKVNSFWIKIKGQNFASQVFSRPTFKISISSFYRPLWYKRAGSIAFAFSCKIWQQRKNIVAWSRCDEIACRNEDGM